MDLAIIAPPKCLELTALSPNFGMVLPEAMHLSPDYVRFFKELEGYKVLDNGLVEGRQFTGTELHHLAYQVDAQCVVVPDAFRDTDTTIRLARDFDRHRNPDLDYMGVLQGMDLSEILKCLYFFDNACEWMTHIGIPRIVNELHKMQRVTLIESILKQQSVGNLRPFKLHALGGSKWITEVVALREYGCHSMDTSLPVVLGLEGFGLHHEYVTRQDDFMERDVDRNSTTWRVLEDNCRTFLDWAGERGRFDSEEAPGG